MSSVSYAALFQMFLRNYDFIFLFFQSVYWFMPSIAFVFLLVGVEGLLGGAAYVNTFYRCVPILELFFLMISIFTIISVSL